MTPAFDPSLVKLKDQSGGEFPSESRASLPATFVIDVSEAGKPDKLSAKVTGPDGKLRKSTIIATGQANIYELSFTPDLAGVYEVLIFINDKPISHTAYRIYCVPVGDASKCLMKGILTHQLFRFSIYLKCYDDNE
ncbi:unnamed protein product [Anisakis simplex]|uniref:Uncharacterized protein n=1 Tax=Anisakis simplex TaxID=6269 RepID=A0A3P6QLM6_ANISI|nr:unnamed protein product [Anisakis simplex]